MKNIPTFLTGVNLITQERDRQINVEDWTTEHDDEHTDGSLAMAAACYAAPTRIFQINVKSGGFTLFDPWPDSWHRKYDNRFGYGTGKTNPGNVLPDPKSYTTEERLDLLAKAGALIAAEIDRIQRMRG